MELIASRASKLSLALSPSSLADLHGFYDSLSRIELRNGRFATLPEPHRMALFFVLAALEKVTPEVEGLALHLVFDSLFSETERSSAIFSTLTNCKILQIRRKVDVNEVEKLRGFFDTCRLLHLGLRRIGDNFFVHPEDVRQIWILLMFVTSSLHETQNFPEVIEFMGTLLVMFLQKRKTDMSIDGFISRFFEHYKYNIEKAEIERKTEQVKTLVPDLFATGFSIDKYQRLYIESLSGKSLNFLCFLYSVKSAMTSPAIGTPVRNVHNSSAQVGRGRIYDFRDAQPRTPKLPSFSNTNSLSIMSSPEKQLRSPAIKKEIESLKYTQNHCEMVEWFRGEVRNISLKTVVIGGVSLQVSAFFQDFTEIEFVRQNLPKIGTLFKKVPPAEETLYTQFYYRVLESLIKQELSDDEHRQSVERVFKDKAFMVSLMALCFELRLFIKNPAQRVSLAEIIEQFECESAFNFYKVLLSFINTCYKRLPILLQAHLHRLETDLLLKDLWAKPKPGQDFVPRLLFTSNEELYVSIYAKISQVMSERLHLVTRTLGVSDEEKELIWCSFEYLLAKGFEPGQPESEYSFKFDIHLDLLFLATIYTWKSVNKVYGALNVLLDPYEQYVIFPFENMRESVLEFYKNNKEVLNEAVHKAGLPSCPKKTILNSTPVRSSEANNRSGSGLFDITLGQLTKRTYREFSAGLSAETTNSLVLTTSNRVGMPMRVFDLGADQRQASQFPTSNQNHDIVMPDHAEPLENANETGDGFRTPQF